MALIVFDRNAWNHWTVWKKRDEGHLKCYEQNVFRNHIFSIDV